MGNRIGKAGHCFAGAGDISSRHDIAVILSDPLHDGLGHSFCYIRPDPSRLSSSKVHSEDDTTHTTTFRSISGASVSANTSTPLSTALIDSYPYKSSTPERASTFQSSTSFASIPLQPVPRSLFQSGSGNLPGLPGSGPIERGFLSGPIERGFLSGPLDRGLDSAPIGKGCEKLQRSLSNGNLEVEIKPEKKSLMKVLRRAISHTISSGRKSIVAPIKSIVSVKGSDSGRNNENVTVSSSTTLSSQLSLNFDDDDEDSESSMKSQNLQWAQGKAGEDRVHMVISEEHGWVFVGIYDGFNGPDAPDYLLTNLYSAVHKELKGLLWNDKTVSRTASSSSNSIEKEQTQMKNSKIDDHRSSSFDKENHPLGNGDPSLDSTSKGKQEKNMKSKVKTGASKTEQSQRSWKCETWNKEKSKPDKEQSNHTNGSSGINQSDVLEALSRALRNTEDAYLEIADKMVMENPELALMGSCVLVMLMKGEHVYLMNVGDSRAVLAQRAESNFGPVKAHKNLDQTREGETRPSVESSDGDEIDRLANLGALQLTMDHSTYVEEEVERIKNEHPDDASAVMNERVKGYLKVTRAFGAGFLKQPKWNDALLEMFRIDYIGTSPYLTCIPSLYHHRLTPRDRFLVLSSDGLYQYFTNEEAVCQVESFLTSFPEGDPAQHLIEEVLFRAAKKAGMDFHELLDIPQGERRRYHDDVSVIIISLEGRIWRSSV